MIDRSQLHVQVVKFLQINKPLLSSLVLSASICGSGRPLTGTCMWEQLTHGGHRDFKEGRGLGPAHHCTLWSCNFPVNVHKPPVNNGIQETESLCGRALWSGISGQKGGRLTKCVFAPLCLNSATCCLPFNAN